MDQDWNKLSIIERGRLINAAHAKKDLSSLKIDEIDFHQGKLRIKIGKNWFSQKIQATANIPAVTTQIDKKGNIVIPSRSLDVRINISWE